jgi:predicted nuclease of predicted toxin-antitoxin system
MRLLLDAHISPAVARGLQHDRIDALALRDWLEGNYLDASDEVILAAAFADERILVTFDLRTIPRLLKEWAESGQQHAGIILIDERTIRQQDVGGLRRALRRLVEQDNGVAWINRVVYLQSVSRG